MILRLVLKSIFARGLVASMTILSIAFSITLFLGVEKVRTGAKASFTDTISDTDLIIGARSGSIQLLLYSIFHIGNATNNLSWESYLEIKKQPQVSWAVPISLGDSHKQFRVMGTTLAFFEHYKFRNDQSLTLAKGNLLDGLYDTVIGADVARSLGYDLKDSIIISHGIASFSEHKDHPFQITGVLEKTGTPIDRTIIVSLEAIEAIHQNWSPTPQSLEEERLSPETITAALVGVERRIDIFGLQRAINNYPKEPLQAILPGVALAELWQVFSIAEKAFLGISIMIICTALIGMLAILYASLNGRRREIAILRALGASPWFILKLLILEAGIICTISSILGMGALYVILLILQPYINSNYGIFIPILAPSKTEISVIIGTIIAGIFISLLPAYRAYTNSLADGMNVKS